MAVSEPSRSRRAVETSFVLATHVVKGMHVILEGFACKVVSAQFAKTGKHGSRKAILTGIDVITGRKYNFGGPGDTQLTSFKPERREYTVLDVVTTEPATSYAVSGSAADSKTKADDNGEIHYLTEDDRVEVLVVSAEHAKLAAAAMAKDKTVNLIVLRVPCPARACDLETFDSISTSK